MEIESIAKNGIITSEIRAVLEEKTRQSGITKSALAKELGVTSVTLHKWLSGSTTRCSLSARKKLLDFLREPARNENPEEFHYEKGNLYPDKMLLCMERIGKAYDICNTSDDNSRSFIGMMDKAAINALQHLVFKELRQKPKHVRKHDA